MNKAPLFPLGIVVACPEALEALRERKLSPKPFLEEHQNGTWGAMDALDRAENMRAIQSGARIVSGYRLSPATRIWIVTYPGRSMTKISLYSLFLHNER